MKTSIKTIAFALALIATGFTASAEDKETNKSTGFGTGIYTTKTGKINVYVDKVNTDASTTVLIKNAKGDIVYRENVGKNEQKFGLTLNVDELAAGKYEIEVKSSGETQTKSFEVTEQKTERVLAIK